MRNLLITALSKNFAYTIVKVTAIHCTLVKKHPPISFLAIQAKVFPVLNQSFKDLLDGKFFSVKDAELSVVLVL